MDSILTLFQTVKEDLNAHRGEWSRPGFQTLAVYRIGRWAKSIKTKVIRAPLYQVAKAGHVFCRNFYGIELPFEADVGKRVVFEHQGGIVVHGNSVIGDGCVLRQGVTLGIKDVRCPEAAPKLESGVDVGAGAKILGDVWIGANATIGANSVVINHIGSNVTAVGVPAKSVARKLHKLKAVGSNRYDY